MNKQSILFFLSFCMILVLLNGCDEGEEILSLDIRPQVKTGRMTVWSGQPLEMEYIWNIGDAVKLPEKNCKILVHFLDGEGNLLLQDDHFPEMPTSEWEKNRAVGYPRTVFLPEFRRTGTFFIKVGLYNPEQREERFGLDGTHGGDHAYLVKEMTIVQKPRWDEIYFEDGWHAPETKSSSSKDRWIWSKGVCRIVTGNPKKDSILYLEAHSPARDLQEPQQVQIFLDDDLLDTFSVAESEKDRILRKIDIPASRMGVESWLHFKIKIDKVFIPADHGSSGDARELGLKVYHFVLTEALL